MHCGSGRVANALWIRQGGKCTVGRAEWQMHCGSGRVANAAALLAEALRRQGFIGKASSSRLHCEGQPLVKDAPLPLHPLISCRRISALMDSRPLVFVLVLLAPEEAQPGLGLWRLTKLILQCLVVHGLPPWLRRVPRVPPRGVDAVERHIALPCLALQAVVEHRVDRVTSVVELRSHACIHACVHVVGRGALRAVELRPHACIHVVGRGALCVVELRPHACVHVVGRGALCVVELRPHACVHVVGCGALRVAERRPHAGVVGRMAFVAIAAFVRGRADCAGSALGRSHGRVGICVCPLGAGSHWWRRHRA
eukprot:363369-Chlamydomonas_euryale.AAC.14